MFALHADLNLKVKKLECITAANNKSAFTCYDFTQTEKNRICLYIEQVTVQNYLDWTTKLAIIQNLELLKSLLFCFKDKPSILFDNLSFSFFLYIVFIK